jgi:hypothetical protein
MSARWLLSAAVALAGLAPLRAQESAPASPPIPTSASNVYSEVTCTTSDAVACEETLQLAPDTRDALTTVLNLGVNWRFPVHIHVLTPDDPLAARIHTAAAQVLFVDNSMTIDAYVPLEDPDAREFIQRQYVTAMVWERFFAGKTKFDKTTPIDIAPLWLVEGLREYANEDPDHSREAIVRRALQNQTAPTLAEVTGWKTLSRDRLFGLWQRAFSYYLVDSLLRESARRDDFQQWLDSYASPAGGGQLHFPTEANWQLELAEASRRNRTGFQTWQETLDEFTADQTITYANAKDAPVQTCTLDSVTTPELTDGLRSAVAEKVDVLTQLERTAHPAWHTTLEAYRAALTRLLQENDEQVPRMLAEAHALEQGQIADHQKLVDYLNWFEVTRDYGITTARYSRYGSIAKQLELTIPDPAHPNPIRAKLLNVESQL